MFLSQIFQGIHFGAAGPLYSNRLELMPVCQRGCARELQKHDKFLSFSVQLSGKYSFPLPVFPYLISRGSIKDDCISSVDVIGHYFCLGRLRKAIFKAVLGGCSLVLGFFFFALSRYIVREGVS